MKYRTHVLFTIPESCCCVCWESLSSSWVSVLATCIMLYVNCEWK
jgi:hypothetical protein